MLRRIHHPGPREMMMIIKRSTALSQNSSDRTDSSPGTHKSGVWHTLRVLYDFWKDRICDGQVGAF